jgi:hypothetical protein
MSDLLEGAEGLGIYNVVPEDFALATFICPSKVEMVGSMRDGLVSPIDEQRDVCHLVVGLTQTCLCFGQWAR